MYQKRINQGLIFVSLLGSLFIVGYFILNVNRGFNLLDEGFYLLSGASPKDVKAQLTSYYNYTHLIMLLSDNIIFLRIFSLLLNIMTISLLSFSSTVLISEKNNKQVTMLLFLSMLPTSFISFIFPIVPNYNNFTVYGSVSFCSVLILFFTAKNKNMINIYAFLLGIIAVFVFFNKFASGVLLLAIAFIAYIIYAVTNRKILNRALFSFIAGAALHLVFFFSCLQSWGQFVSLYKLGFKSVKIIQSHHSLGLLLQYYQQVKELILFSFSHYGLVIYSSMVIIILQQIHYFFKLKTFRLLAGYFLLVTFFLLSYFINRNIENEKFITLSSFYFSGLIVMFLISLINLVPTDWSKLKQIGTIKLSLILLLLWLPFIIASGTANVLYMQILFGIFVWVSIILLLSSVGHKSIMNTFTYTTLAGFSLLSTYYTYTLLNEMPYGLYGSLEQQTNLTKIGNSQLYVDSTTKYIIDSTRHELSRCGFKSNDFLVSLTDVPGLTYAVQGRSPSCPWYFGLYKGSDKLTQFCLGLSPDIKSPYVLLASFNGQIPNFAESQLGAYFKNFSTSYQICGEVKNIPTQGGACCKVPVDNIKIYKPKV